MTKACQQLDAVAAVIPHDEIFHYLNPRAVQGARLLILNSSPILAGPHG